MHLRSLTAACSLVVLLVACSDDASTTTDDGSGSQSTEAPAEGGEAVEHNEADEMFAQNMIPHHEQAVTMSDLAAEQAEDERVLDIAERIKAAQEPELETLRGFIAAFGLPEERGDMDMGTDDMGAMEGMEGMMSEEDMAELEAATGAEFDVMYLEMMIEHHQGAVSMADTEIAEGQFPDAIAMAESIKESQEAEITEMETLLEELQT